jgi:hypothetical protein
MLTLLLALVAVGVAVIDVLSLAALAGPIAERLGGVGVVLAAGVALVVAVVVPFTLGRSVVERLRSLEREPRPIRTLAATAVGWNAALMALLALVTPGPFRTWFRDNGNWLPQKVWAARKPAPTPAPAPVPAQDPPTPPPVLTPPPAAESPADRDDTDDEDPTDENDDNDAIDHRDTV